MPLRLTLEDIPFGDEARTEKIGSLYIINMGVIIGAAGETDLRAYTVADTVRGGPHWNVRHHRSDGAWELCRLAIVGRPR